VLCEFFGEEDHIPSARRLRGPVTLQGVTGLSAFAGRDP
jgi:hypothetical protein